MSEAAQAQVQEAPPPDVTSEAHEPSQEDAADIAAQFGFDVSDETQDAPSPSQKTAKAQATENDDEKPTDPLELVKSDDLFSERALSNQTGIGKARHALLAARKAVRDQYQANHRTHLELAERETRIKEAGGDLKKRMQSFESHEKRFLADVDIALNGKPGEVLEAIGRIARRSGQELYEGMTAALLEAKKKPQVDPETRAKLSKIDELEAKLKTYEEKETTRSDTEKTAVARERWVKDVAATFDANKDDYPNIKHFVDQQKAADVLVDLENLNMKLWENSGRPSRGIPLDVLLGQLDRMYSKLPREEVQEEEPRVAAKKNGRLPGSGPSPARAATNGQTRELTEDERMQELASDKDALRAYGFMV